VAGAIHVHQLGVAASAPIDEDVAQPHPLAAAGATHAAERKHVCQVTVATDLAVGKQIANAFPEPAALRQG
jgi:hypothetical protein